MNLENVEVLFEDQFQNNIITLREPQIFLLLSLIYQCTLYSIITYPQTSYSNYMWEFKSTCIQ